MQKNRLIFAEPNYGRRISLQFSHAAKMEAKMSSRRFIYLFNRYLSIVRHCGKKSKQDRLVSVLFNWENKEINIYQMII